VRRPEKRAKKSAIGASTRDFKKAVSCSTLGTHTPTFVFFFARRTPRKLLLFPHTSTKPLTQHRCQHSSTARLLHLVIRRLFALLP
jgi:hypothetical protein